MRKEWFTANELAGLPMLAETSSGIIRAAKRDHWKKRKRSKGKGFEYHISNFPMTTQMAIEGLQLAKQTAHIEKRATYRRVLTRRDIKDLSKTLLHLAQMQATYAEQMMATARNIKGFSGWLETLAEENDDA